MAGVPWGSWFAGCPGSGAGLGQKVYERVEGSVGAFPAGCDLEVEEQAACSGDDQGGRDLGIFVAGGLQSPDDDGEPVVRGMGREAFPGRGFRGEIVQLTEEPVVRHGRWTGQLTPRSTQHAGIRDAGARLEELAKQGLLAAPGLTQDLGHELIFAAEVVHEHARACSGGRGQRRDGQSADPAVEHVAGAGIEQRCSSLGLRMAAHGLNFTRNDRYVYSADEGSRGH